MVRPSRGIFPPGFELPDALAAPEPPEARGLGRDGIRLLAVNRGNGQVTHTFFNRIGDLLKPGDCLVFNASRTLPASLRARLREASGPGAPVEVRLARRLDARTYAALLLDALENPWSRPDGETRGLRLDFGGGLDAEVAARDPADTRLWTLRFGKQGTDLMAALSRLGDPVRYWYAARPWDLDYYQTVYAREPGSMEMPSAGRAFTWRLLLELRRRGVETAFLVLHAGLSSYMDAEFDATHPASEEPYRISPEAADKVNACKAAGGRVVAVGTTVVRALESAAEVTGRIRPRETATRLRITRDHRLRAVDGLLTGFHEPEASHLDLLMAFLPEDRLRAAYQEALRERYFWHEFGDANLIL